LRIVTGAFANCLQQVCFACRWPAANPSTGSLFTCNNILQECHERFISCIQKTFEYSVILKL
jgi:hypothetical protein